MNHKTSIQPGRYRHFKGNEYTVIGTARHSETLEEFVVYRQEYGDHGLWARPKQMFSETVKVEGQDVPRFQPFLQMTAVGMSAVGLSAGCARVADDGQPAPQAWQAGCVDAAFEPVIHRTHRHLHLPHAGRLLQ